MSRNMLKKYVLTTVSILVLVLLIMFVNLYADPLSLINSKVGYIKSAKVAENMSNNMNSDKIDGTVDERMVKRIFIENHINDCTATTMALGSSRAALISSDMLNPNESLINLSVTGAELKEIIALYGLARSNGYLPENLIISLDMWWLNSNYSGKRFNMSLADAYDAYVTEVLGYSDSGIDPDNVEGRFKGEDVSFSSSVRSFLHSDADIKSEIFSVHYLQNSLQYLFCDRINTVIAIDPSVKYTDHTMIRHDGSYSYSPSFRDATVSEAYNRALEAISVSILGCEDYYELDPELCDLFKDFLSSVQEDGVNIRFVMLPLHPTIEFHMRCYDKYDVALSAEDWFRNVAEEYEIPVSGSFSADKNGFGEDAFYDALHVKDSYVAVLISELEENA